MALGLLCLGLNLLGDLQTQAQEDITLTLNMGPNLNEAPLQPILGPAAQRSQQEQHERGYIGVQSYTMKVAATNYNEFALMFFQKVFKYRMYFKATIFFFH
ncbi:hypothetical protein GW7_01928 [Heterocephalus glaber]|uniref:Uncharacterized protein n=1 Tax=Heterocephalus glaber TaxID=10181 RepID=G5ASF8_HETGA|nr:hypothetical protein GW7_01928 [Heterocephalus glaber]